MEKFLRILVIEDSESDTLLVLRAIAKAGYQYEFKRVENYRDLDYALESEEWDIILCDYSMPQFSAPSAIELIKSKHIDLPIIIVSGNLGEESAVSAMKLGAHDYVLKDNLSRLVPAIEREIVEFQERKSRQKAEKALLESQAKYQSIFNAVNDGILVLNFNDLKVIEANLRAIEMSGYKARDLVGSYFGNLNLDTQFESDKNWFKKVQKGKSVFFETEIEFNKDKKIWTEFSIKKDIINDQDILIAVVRDITERKNFEDALSISEMRFRSIVDNSHESIVIIDNNFKINYVNDIICELVGRPRQDLLDTDFRKYLREETRTLIEKYFIARQSGQDIPSTYEINLEGVDGNSKRVIISASVIKDASGKMFTVAQLLDISDRYQYELNLKESEEKYRSVVESASDAIFIFANGKYTYINSKAESILGYSHEEFVNLKPYEVIHPDDKKSLQKVDKKWENGEDIPLNYKFRVLPKNGEEKWLETNRARIELNESRSTLIFAKDITNQIKLENRLQVAHKMEAIGTLAGGIAHDFNNILAPIMGFAELMVEKEKENEFVLECSSQILNAANRATDLVRQILAFSHHREQEKHPVYLKGIIEEAGKLLRATTSTTIELEIDIEPDISPVYADATQIHQVIMNLGTNAYHAMMEKGGKLFIGLKKKTITAKDTAQFPELEPGEYAVISVEDNGEGIEEAYLDKIFDPFFTTKQKGSGTGMGLAVAHGIVSNHNGFIDVYSEKNKGSSFKVLLPFVEGKGKTIEAGSKSEIIAGNNESVMIVDDEQSILDLLYVQLIDLGYRAKVFNNSLNALSEFEKNPNKYDVIITDQNMPGLRGDQLAAKMLIKRKNIPIIICTGFSEHLDKESATEIGIRNFLLKPILKSELSTAVNNVLNN